MHKIIIGSRGSKLALTQSNMVIDQLKKYVKDVEFEIKVITTTGDIILDKTLDKIGGKGLFVLEIEKALKDNEIDLAIHSMKDVPNNIDEVFEITSILKREDPRDVLISKNNKKLEDMASGSVIGTSSLRRAAQIKNLRPDLRFEPIRGNVDTRIKKVKNEEFDGIILAAAGLNRIGLKNEITQYFDVVDVVPAVGQGALCVEFRKNDEFIKNIIKELNKYNEIRDVLAERVFLEATNGSCSVAMGAFGEVKEDKLTLTGFYCENINEPIIKNVVCGRLEDYEILGKNLAEKCKLGGNL